MTKSFKDINAACLGCFPVECETEELQQNILVHEHAINVIKETALLNNISKEYRFYFEVNCFIPPNEFSTSTANISVEITASIEKDQLYGVQFNLERSGEPGLQILKNFLDI
jgi:glutamine amidotransferase